MKKSILFIFLLGVLNCFCQSNSETIIGIWKLEKEVDLRTFAENGKSNEPQIIESDEIIETFLTFTKNKKIEYNKTEFGKWEIKNDSLLVYKKVSKNNEHLNEKIRDEYLKDEFLVLKKDGIYYSKAYKWRIKYLKGKILEMGNEKRYTKYKKMN